MKFVFKCLRFVGRYLITNPLYTISYGLVFWRKGYSFKAHLFSESEFIAELKKGKSLIRVGDGEINLMLGLRNHYQNFSPILKNFMFLIVRSYRHDSSYMLSIPRFVNVTNGHLKKLGKFQVWLPLKVMFGLYFNKKVPYLDAHSFYYDGYFERTVGKFLIDKHVVLITKKETIITQKANKKVPWSRVSYIEAPESEALSSYEFIKNKIDQTIQVTAVKDIVLLFAMGPVGKKLAYEFAERGIQSIDIGKVAEVFYTDESIAYIV